MPAKPAARPIDGRERLFIADAQSGSDQRRLAIQRVGVKGLHWPLTLRVGDHAQQAAAEWNIAVALPAHARGAHMSRFIEWLDRLPSPMDAITWGTELGAMLSMLGATQGRVEVRFPFFLRKYAPASGIGSLLDYQGCWIAEKHADRIRLWSEVGVPVKSLCPCSKEISDHGAHNQRSKVRIQVEMHQPIEWQELVRFAEDAASSELWPLLKREDEKWVTERAYGNPKFVEDLVRDVALQLDGDSRIGGYVIEVENLESIHNHSAYACIERVPSDRPPQAASFNGWLTE